MADRTRDAGGWTAGFAALCLGQFLGHQTGLAFSALIPILGPEWRLSASQSGVILGAFQLGTLVTYAMVGFLLDRVRSKPIMAWSAALVGLGDLAFALGARDFSSGLALRLTVGVCIGGLYLPALKQIADTVPAARRGMATGVYIATIVAAYALPLFYVGALAPRIGWRATMAGIGALELLGALVMAWRVPSVGVAAAAVPSVLSRYVGDVFKNASARRVIVAYTGHNWELFGLWGWLAPFLVASLAGRGGGQGEALAWGGLLAAGAVGLGGAAGAVAGGRLSDRLGRARAATAMLAASLLCSLGFGWLVGAPTALVAAVALVYSTVSLADSPSYTATLMEVVPGRSLGGAFAIQMLFGWAATAASPAAFGLVLDLGGALGFSPTAQWGSAFGLLALGPLAGIAALGPWRDARRERPDAVVEG
ncbi:MAG: MFS transporter [Armatimonadota bacterium]|nr:MFS transporter [Armatimonadota bacterium]